MTLISTQEVEWRKKGPAHAGPSVSEERRTTAYAVRSTNRRLAWPLRSLCEGDHQECTYLGRAAPTRAPMACRMSPARRRIARGGQHGDEMVSEGLNADVRRTAVPAPSAPPGLRAARRSHANARLSGDARDRDGGIRKLEYVGVRSFVFYSGCPYDWHHFSISDFTSNPRNAGVCFDGGK